VNRRASRAGFFRISPSGDRVTPVAVLVGELAGVRQHRHAAHRVPDQHDHPAWRDRLQHGFQVVAELGQRVGLGRAFAGAPVPALVVEDHPDLMTQPVGEAGPLKMEGAHAQAESVDEDQGHLRIHRAGFADRQLHPVGRGHLMAAVAVERVEILIGVRVFDFDGALGHRAAGRGSDDGGYRGHPGAARKPSPAPVAPAGSVRAQRFRPRDRFG